MAKACCASAGPASAARLIAARPTERAVMQASRWNARKF
jgi:hypothetical protein